MDTHDKAANRFGEDAGTSYFRSHRIIVMNGKYYFMTRENSQEGPFESRLEAEQELDLYIRHMTSPKQAKQN